ncbi:MAG: enoyl-CoA hydratase/isomerase family protein, partial [Pseudomonadales bacterium]|nr:enoyl-CoA hydratase/isomerase family protein [Pseudomonadales bacterium]
LVYQQLHRSIDMSLAQVFEMELNIAMQCVAHPDFREGVRALLIDKDRNPHWHHNSIADVPDEWISEHFQPY